MSQKRKNSNTTLDLLVIGGGISGATILWDATLRGLQSMLVEKADYGSGTSQATSRLIHGGLRYLVNYEFGLVRESLHERRLLARIAPHAMQPCAFLMPLYRHRSPGRLIMGTGLRIYDFLGRGRNRDLNPELHIPASQYLDRAASLALEPGIEHRGLTGSYIYYDYANRNPERLCAEFILGAKASGARALNYTRAESIEREGEVYRVELIDSLNGKKRIVFTKSIVNACGPWADLLDQKMQSKSEHNLVRSKGIHIITRKLAGDRTVILIRPNGSHMFIIPFHGKSLIGTTDTIYKDHPDNFHVTPEDVENLMQDTNQLYPMANLKWEDIVYYYGGMRPLVEDSESTKGSTYTASRKVEIENHTKSGLPGYFTVLGGKYTTSRLLAEKIIDQICEFLPGQHKACSTTNTSLPGGAYSDFQELLRELHKKYPSVDEQKILNLARRYGSQAEDIIKRKPAGIIKLDNGEIYYLEEIDAIVEQEDIRQLSDLYFRRTSMGLLGRLPETTHRQIAKRVSDRLRWKQPEVRNSNKEIKRYYKLA